MLLLESPAKSPTQQSLKNLLGTHKKHTQRYSIDGCKKLDHKSTHAHTFARTHTRSHALTQPASHALAAAITSARGGNCISGVRCSSSTRLQRPLPDPLACAPRARFLRAIHVCGPQTRVLVASHRNTLTWNFTIVKKVNPKNLTSRSCSGSRKFRCAASLGSSYFCCGEGRAAAPAA